MTIINFDRDAQARIAEFDKKRLQCADVPVTAFAGSRAVIRGHVVVGNAFDSLASVEECLRRTDEEIQRLQTQRDALTTTRRILKGLCKRKSNQAQSET